MRTRCLLPLALALLVVPATAAVTDDLAVPGAASACPPPSGAVVGRVSVEVGDIFDPTDPREDRALYRAANQLHIDTREEAIRAQLLFREGDAFSAPLLAETERNLRTLRFLNGPSVRVAGCHDGLVDVEVRARDVWTLTPGVSFGRAGGRNHTRFEFEELNLFGRGKQLAVAYSTDPDRRTRQLRWRDPNVLGSRWTDELEIADSDDGHRRALVIERPFFALATPWAAALAVSDERREEDRYALGEAVDSYRVDRRFLDVYGGRSTGLVDGWVRRLGVGYRYDHSDFSRLPDTGALDPPADRRLAYPYLRLELLEDGFEVSRNHDQIGRAEDLHLGRRLVAELGLVAPAFGADRTAAQIGLRASAGFHPAEDHTTLLALGLDGRLEGGGLRDALLSASARHYWRTSPRTLLFAGVSADVGHALDADHTLLLGGDNGLRGYPLRYQAGSARALLTLEGRLFTNWYPFRLFHVGAAVFADVGRVWGTDPLATPKLGLLRDVGVGLRLGNGRSALGNVVHVDLAMPLDGDGSRRDLQILVQTHRSF